MKRWKVALAIGTVAVLAVAIVAVRGIPRFPLTSSSGNGLNDGNEGGNDWQDHDEDDDDQDDDDEGKRADFSLFTTEATGGVADDYVTCLGDGPFLLHIAVTNYDVDEKTLRIVFQDTDLVNYFVPQGTSFSFVQVAGTSPGIDDAIKIDPLDQDKDVNPMVGWVSAIAENSGSVVCTVTTF